jgi:hypothetical protein
LNDVQTLVRARLTQEKRRAAIAKFTDDLRVRADTQIHPELLGSPPTVPSAAKRD